MTESMLWEAAKSSRSEALKWLKDQKVSLDPNPAKNKNIGGLNELIAQVRDMAIRVRDELFDAQGVMILLRNVAHSASDAYEDRMADIAQNVTTWEDAQIKKLPKTADERERYFRKDCLPEYRAKIEAERRVEEWEQYQKMLNTIHYSLKDTNNDMLTQISVIKQQYFSGEIELDKRATSLMDFLSPEAKEMVGSASGRIPLEDIPMGEAEVYF